MPTIRLKAPELVCCACGEQYQTAIRFAGNAFCSRRCQAYWSHLSRWGTVEERFWREVTKSPDPRGCWERRATAGLDGYSRIFVNGKRIKAHRWSYERFCGPIPDGMVVRHLCNNPGCVRPEHLSLGTQADNVADRAKAGHNSNAHLKAIREAKKAAAG